jgi:hypothetical protein
MAMRPQGLYSVEFVTILFGPGCPGRPSLENLIQYQLQLQDCLRNFGNPFKLFCSATLGSSWVWHWKIDRVGHIAAKM